MSRARGQQPELTRTELERVIYEANLGEEDGYIARRYFVDRVCQIDIAYEVSNRSGLEMSRSTISRRLEWIRKQLNRTAQKITANTHN